MSSGNPNTDTANNEQTTRLKDKLFKTHVIGFFKSKSRGNVQLVNMKPLENYYTIHTAVLT